MLAITSPRVAHSPPGQPGRFAWRYLDLVDNQVDGLVLFWGWGLPFHCPPATASPADHPSINLVVYRGGRTIFYHLESLEPSRVSRGSDGWRFGDSLLQSRRAADGWAVDVEVDLPIAGSPLRARGQISLRGPAVHGIEARGGSHLLAPISSVAQARAHLTFGGEDVRFAGRGYHDENVGEHPLPGRGNREWAWGRVAEPESEVLHYRFEGEVGVEGMEVVIAEGGRAAIRPLESWSEQGRIGGAYGLAACGRLAYNGRTVRADPVVDESAFYLRFPLRTATGRGWGERVRPGAIATWWMRPSCACA